MLCFTTIIFFAILFTSLWKHLMHMVLTFVLLNFLIFLFTSFFTVREKILTLWEQIPDTLKEPVNLIVCICCEVFLSSCKTTFMKRKFLKVKVINSTSIGKMNNHLPPQTIEQKTSLKTYKLEIQVLAWDRYKNVGGLNQLL